MEWHGEHNKASDSESDAGATCNIYSYTLTLESAGCIREGSGNIQLANLDWQPHAAFMEANLLIHLHATLDYLHAWATLFKQLL